MIRVTKRLDTPLSGLQAVGEGGGKEEEMAEKKAKRYEESDVFLRLCFYSLVEEKSNNNKTTHIAASFKFPLSSE